MKNFKIILAFLLTSIFFISCSDESGSNQTHKNLLLQWSDKDNGLKADYTYDSDNKLINYKLNGNANNPSRDYNFSYNADGTLDELINASSGEILQKYTYNSDKKLIKMEGGSNVHNYTYSGSEVTDNYRYSVTNTGWREVYTYDSKGNIIEAKSYSNASDANPLGTYSGIITYTYDDKNNAQSSVPSAFLFPNSVNNIKSDNYDNEGGEVYTYEYNADNYPVKRTGYDVRTYVYQRL
jgi:hypothetical protein